MGQYLFMKNILKKINHHDLSIFLLLVIVFIPYKTITFYLGHIYWHEIILGIYFLTNIIFLSLNRKNFKNLFNLTQIQKLFFIFIIFYLINFIVSLFLLKDMEKLYLTDLIKVRIDILRGYCEFIIVFIFSLIILKIVIWELKNLFFCYLLLY